MTGYYGLLPGAGITSDFDAPRGLTEIGTISLFPAIARIREVSVRLRELTSFAEPALDVFHFSGSR
jgi:hypothetical protein